MIFAVFWASQNHLEQRPLTTEPLSHGAFSLFSLCLRVSVVLDSVQDMPDQDNFPRFQQKQSHSSPPHGGVFFPIEHISNQIYHIQIKERP